MNNISIEKMNIDDITYIKKLEEDQGINILSYNSIKEDLSNDNYSYFICKMSEEIVGYIAISHVIDTMDILSIVVKGNYHRLGIATYMINYVISFANNNNITKILLEVRKSNIPAISLYKKLGFEEISLRKNYYTNPIEDALIFEKNLKNTTI